MYYFSTITLKKSKMYTKFESPIRTEVITNLGQDVTFLGETEKAYLAIFSWSAKKGTSLVSTLREVEKWIPKSVWDNEKNFEEHSQTGEMIFNVPYYLK